MTLPKRIGSLNKRFLNRLTLKVAGKANSPFALVRHQGRKSGRLYETPVIVVRTEDGFLFALTYGPDVDWYQNLLAAGSGSLRWNGKEFVLKDPQVVDKISGRKLFHQPKTTILGWLKIEHFFKMIASEV